MMNMLEALVRPSVRAVRPYVPGTTVEQARRMYGHERLIKLSSNENPWGSSPRALEALQAISALNVYVDDEYTSLRSLLAARLNVDVAQVVLGHGSNEILALLFTLFVGEGDEVVMAVPSFSLYRTDTLIQGGVPVEVPLLDGVHDLTAMAQAITPRTKMLVLCDPNNPTATQIAPQQFETFLRLLPEHLVLVIDQAYCEFATQGIDGIDAVRRRPHTIVLRTASKIYGLAALRFGYAVSSPEIIGWLARIRLPFNVALPALAAITAALGDDDFIEHSIRMNVQERRRLSEGFARLGLFVYPSEANFLAVRVPSTAAAAYEALLRRGIIVRSGDGLRMANFLRITVGKPEENDALLHEMGEYLDECSGMANAHE